MLEKNCGTYTERALYSKLGNTLGNSLYWHLSSRSWKCLKICAGPMQIVSYPELWETILKGNHPSTSFSIVHRYKGLKPLSRDCKEMLLDSTLRNSTVGKPP